jgi:hypothetical protein
MKPVWVVCAFAACSATPPTPPEAAVSQSLAIGPDLDILFVIDNSASTSDKQTLLMQDLPALVTQLDNLAGGRPNLHIGVVTTTVDIGETGFSNGNTGCPSPDPADDGRLQGTQGLGAQSGCPTPTDRYIVDVAQPDGTRLTNYTGTLADTLGCIGQVGEEGCGFEAPLEAMKRALDGSRPENAGFLRPGATLAVVILTDEDDASVSDPAVFTLPTTEVGPGDFRLQPFFAYDCDAEITLEPGTFNHCVPRTDSYLRAPGDYYDFLTSLDGPSQIVVALLAGDASSTIETDGVTIGGFTQSLALSPSCTTTLDGNVAVGRPAIRLVDFLGRFGDHGLFQSVCQPSYSAAMTGAGQLMGSAIGSCLSTQLAAIDPAHCEVTEGAVTLPPCESTGGTGTCWTMVTDAACTTPSQRALHVERGATPSAAYDRVTCAP